MMNVPSEGSDYAANYVNAQTDQNLRDAHMSEGTFLTLRAH